MFTSVDIRGVLRGQCSLDNCECDSFARPSCPEVSGTSNASLQCGWCCYCGHPPTSHSRLGTQDVVQEQPLTDESTFVADEAVKCEVHFVPEEGSEEAVSSPPAPKRSHIELEALPPEPDLCQRVAQLEKENEELRKYLPGEETAARQQEILSVSDEITNLLGCHENSVRRLLECVAPQHSQLAVDSMDSRVLKLLPVSTHQSLQQLEQHLSVAKNRSDLVAHFSRIHGSSLQNAARQLLRRCMQDTLAQDFSLLGKKGKRPFIELQLLRVVRETLLRSYENATEFHIHQAVSAWLRSAPARHKKLGESPSSSHLCSP